MCAYVGDYIINVDAVYTFLFCYYIIVMFLHVLFSLLPINFYLLLKHESC